MKEQNFLEGFGSRLKYERVQLDLTQEQIAEQCEISRVQWGKYEREVATPSRRVMNKLDKMGLDTAYILTGEKTIRPKAFHEMTETEKKLYQMENAEKWVNEAEQQNGIVFHPAFKQMLNSAVALHGLSRAGIFNLIDGLALFAKKDESIFLSMETKNPIN